MRPLVVVELEPGSDPFSSLTRGVVLVKIDLLPFQAPPEAFCKDVIRGSSFPVHADLDLTRLKAFQIAVAGKMASLIAVPDVRNSGLKSPVHTGENKRQFQCAIEFP